MAKEYKQEDIDAGFEKYVLTLEAESPEVGKLLRIHLLVEHYLDQILKKEMKKGDILTKGNRVSVFRKINIVEAMDIFPAHIIEGLYKLNSLRNKCVHSLEYKISESDLDEIGELFGEEYSEMKSEYKELTSTVEELLGFTVIHIVAELHRYTL